MMFVNKPIVVQTKKPAQQSNYLDLQPIQKELLDAVESNNKQKFISLGGATTADLNFAISSDQMFLLLIAAAKGFTEIIELMWSNSGLDVNKQDAQGVNAFWVAAWFGRVDVMRQLHAMKIDVTATNLNGSNCLHIGVKLGHMDVVKEVIKLKGFPVDAIKKNGVSAMGIAAYKGSLEMMDILSSKSDLNFTNLQGIGPMYLAIKGNKPDAIRYLIGKKVRIHYDKQEQNDNSPIFYAIRQNNQTAIELFCDYQKDQLNYFTDTKGNNTIMYAALHSNYWAVNYLSVRGLLLDVEDREGKSLLARVLMADQYELALKLLSRGATVNYQNREGQTALVQLLLQRRIPQCKFMMVNGCAQHLEDRSGRDACDYATVQDIRQIPELLQECRGQQRQKWFSKLEQQERGVLNVVEERLIQMGVKASEVKEPQREITSPSPPISTVVRSSQASNREQSRETSPPTPLQEDDKFTKHLNIIKQRLQSQQDSLTSKLDHQFEQQKIQNQTDQLLKESLVREQERKLKQNSYLRDRRQLEIQQLGFKQLQLQSQFGQEDSFDGMQKGWMEQDILFKQKKGVLLSKLGMRHSSTIEQDRNRYQQPYLAITSRQQETPYHHSVLNLRDTYDNNRREREQQMRSIGEDKNLASRRIQYISNRTQTMLESDHQQVVPSYPQITINSRVQREAAKLGIPSSSQKNRDVVRFPIVKLI